jgi:acetyl-CoA acyltransferase
MPEAVIVSAVRTPVGRAPKGALSTTRPDDLAATAMSSALQRLPGLDPKRINVNGGAIALGHPLGCTGAKLTATLLHEMSRRQLRYGMVIMCVGGGMGAAAIFERL